MFSSQNTDDVADRPIRRGSEKQRIELVEVDRKPFLKGTNVLLFYNVVDG